MPGGDGGGQGGWSGALRRVVLPFAEQPLVIFVDEIDLVRRLPFSTDEFFAGIRSLYNQRTEDNALKQLTFCLLGVASPSELVRDPQLTPFNIGYRVTLEDFTLEEALPLAAGLGFDSGTNARLFKRIYHWTHGHPYLTQRLCQEIRAGGKPLSDREVDARCLDLFLRSGYREQDTNLLHVRDRLLDPSQDTDTLLTTYRRIWQGKPVADREANPVVSQLHLSGVVRSENGQLRVRNRVYARAFDRRWVAEHLSGAEVRRQREAFRRAVGGTSVLAGVLIGLVTYGLIMRAEAQTLIQVRAVLQLVAAEQVVDTDPTLAAAFLREAAHFSADQLEATPGPVSMNGKTVPDMMDGAAQRWRKVALAALEGGAARAMVGHVGHRVLSVGLRPGSLELGVILADQRWRRLRLGTPTLPSLEPPQADDLLRLPTSLAFSPDGKRLGVGTVGAGLQLIPGPGADVPPQAPVSCISKVAFSTDGQHLAWQEVNGMLKLAGHARGSARQPFGPAHVVDFHFLPGSLLGLMARGTLLSQALEDGLEARPVPLSCAAVDSLAVAPDGTLLAVACADGTRHLKAPQTGEERPLKGTPRGTSFMRFSHDGRWLLVGDEGGGAFVWDAREDAPPEPLSLEVTDLADGVFSLKDDRIVLAGRDGRLYLWNVSTHRLERRLPVSSVGFESLEVTSDPEAGAGVNGLLLGRLLDGSARVWRLSELVGAWELVGARSGLHKLSSGALLERLQSSVLACVPPVLRAADLMELTAEASASYARCLEELEDRP